MSKTKSTEPTVRILWPLTGVVIALGLVYGLLWALLAVGLRDAALSWVEAQRRQGWAIAHEAPQVQGFPSWPELKLNAVSITAPPGDGGWTWQTDSITLVATIYNLTRLTIHASDDHTFHWPSATQEPWTVTSDHTMFDIALGRRGRWRGARLSIGRAELSGPMGRPLTGVARLDATLALASSTAAVEGRLRGDVFASFTGSANDVQLALNLGPLDRTVRTFRLDADLVGPVRPGRLSEALEAWRNGGGTLEVRHLLLDWPPLTIDADPPSPGASTRRPDSGEHGAARRSPEASDRPVKPPRQSSPSAPPKTCVACSSAFLRQTVEYTLTNCPIFRGHLIDGS